MVWFFDDFGVHLLDTRRVLHEGVAPNTCEKLAGRLKSESTDEVGHKNE